MTISFETTIKDLKAYYDWESTGIPVTFEYKGETYKAWLHEAKYMGSNNASFQMTIKKRFQGTLRLSEFDNEWRFDSSDGKFKGMGDWLGQYVVSWRDGVGE